MKKWQYRLLALIALLITLCIFVFVQVRTLEVEQLSDDLFVLRGLGGNTAVLRTSAGTVVVDTMTLPLQGRRIRELAIELTGADVVLLINTHYHLDHTHGNPAFEAGTRVLSTERTLSHLETLDADFWTGEAARLLPTETFSDRMTLQVGDKTMQLIHPGAGHTDGDLVVLFRDEKVLHTGDLMFNRLYPSVDLEAGGSVPQWVLSLEIMLQLDFDRVIPGHGATTDRAGLKQFLTFMTQLADIGREVANREMSLEDTLTTTRLTADEGYQAIHMIIPLPLDREFVLTRVWEEATGNFQRLN
ncbi:MAG: MBL fold metallo-hydrolase [Pseudomonadales bacterium]|nr:MBL fold metallo-hydrolase [Pseudomonadales bacterium]